MSNLSDEEVAVLAELRGYRVSYEQQWWIEDTTLGIGKRWVGSSDTQEGILRELRRLVDRDFGGTSGGTHEGTKEDGAT